MNTYAILRRSGWRSPADLQEAATRSTQVADEEMPDEVRWIRSDVRTASAIRGRRGR